MIRRTGRRWWIHQEIVGRALWVICFTMLLGCAQHSSLPNKVVVITGGASELGKGIARALSDQGAHVVLPAHTVGSGHKGATTDVEPAETIDVVNQNDVERLAQAALAHFGRIDVWINGAGIAEFGRFDEVPPADHAHMVQTNLLGVLYGSHVAMSRFREQGFGTLINIGSLAGKIGTPYYASYSAAEFGVVGLGQALNEELRVTKMRDIHVSTIIPIDGEAPLLKRAITHTRYASDVHSMDASDESEDVIKAIVTAVAHPKNEIPVGFQTTSSVLFHRWAPDTAENFLGERIQALYAQQATAPGRGRIGSLYINHPHTLPTSAVKTTTIAPRF